MSHPPVYYTVRSVVRFAFWGGLAFLFLWLCASIGNATGKNIPDCEYFHYPCETTTTVYDPYGYGVNP